MTKQRILYGSIEIGGTKINCAVAETTRNSNSIPSILEEKQIKTKTPDFNLNEIFKFFNPYNIHSLGVGSFGPISLTKIQKILEKLLQLLKFHGEILIC